MGFRGFGFRVWGLGFGDYGHFVGALYKHSMIACSSHLDTHMASSVILLELQLQQSELV